MTKKLTEILSPKAHQRIINRYMAILNGGSNPSHLLPETLLKKIEWHTNQHLLKTGQLPK